jgi:hypothetical protein
MFRVFTFGGCPLYNPMRLLKEARIASHPFKAMGFKRPPFALSSGAAIQLMKFSQGKIAIPKNVRDLCYGDSEPAPTEQHQAALAKCDIALVELSTPIEIVYDGFVLNNNRLKDRFIHDIARQVPQAGKALRKWRSVGLQGVKDAVRSATAAEALEFLPKDTERDLFVRDVIGTATARETKTPQIVADLGFLRSQLPMPMGMILHNFNYMPDGRPISWPADFRDNCLAAAQELNIPVYDPAPLVAEHGTSRAMKNERHYSDAFLPLVADAFHEFIRQTIGGKVGPVAKVKRRPPPARRSVEPISLGL